MSKKHVLIAEDDQFLSGLMEKSLIKKGVSVTVVSNGAEAIVAIKKKKPDLLLLDILMPEVDGYGVLLHIQESGHDIATVIISNLSSANDRAECKRLGCKAFIVKSDINDDGLWPAIEKYLK